MADRIRSGRDSSAAPLDPSWASAGSPGDGDDPGGDNPIAGQLRLLRRNLWLVLSLGLLGLGAATYFVLTEPPLYRAHSVVRFVDDRSQMAVGPEGAAVARMTGSATEALSQLEVLKSRGMIAKVVDGEGLRFVVPAAEMDPGLVRDVRVSPEAPSGEIRLRFSEEGVSARGPAGEARAAYGQPLELDGVRFTVASAPEVDSVAVTVRSREAAIGHLERYMRAWPRERTNVADIEYVDHDPRMAQRVVNSLAGAFQEWSRETAQQQSHRRRLFLEEQLSRTDSLFREAQIALSAFRTREEVFSSQERFTQQQVGLMGLDVRLQELEADRAMYRSLLAGLERAPHDADNGIQAIISTPAMAQNPVMVQLYAQLAAYEAARDSLTAGPFGKVETSPEVRRVSEMIASTRGKLREAARTQLGVLDARVAALHGLREQNAAEIRTLPPREAEEVRLVQRAEALSKVADQLLEELQRARMVEAVEAGNIEIVDLAPLPTEPLSTGRVRKLIFGLLLGLAAGGAAANLRERTNTSVRRREDVEQLLRVPSLAVVPHFGGVAPRGGRIRFPWPVRNGRAHANGNGSGGDVGLVAISDPRSPGAEAFRTLRTNLVFSQSVQSLQVLVVTSSTPGEGKTTTSANLAVAFAQQGMRVLLVDCDLRKPRAHEMFGVPREPGLTNLVVGGGSAEAVVRETAVEGLSILAAGTLPPNPAEILGGPRLRELLQSLAEGFDLVLLDTPPLLAASDAASRSRQADGVLLVVRAGQTDRAAVRQAVQQLATVGAHVFGAVLNDPEGAVSKQGGYYQYEYYGVER